MKIVQAKQVEVLQSEIKQRFTEFNRSSSTSKRRRYPDELKELLQQAYAQGVKVGTLCRLAGVSRPVVKGWLAPTEASAPVKARCLAVVNSAAAPARAAVPVAAVVVRLPSGVTIELVDSRALSPDLLAGLCNRGGGHATSR